MGCLRRKVTVIPNAVDVEAFSLAQPPDPRCRRSLGLAGRTVVGFIGSFYAYEGLDLLVQAMPALIRQRPDICLLLVGGGPQESCAQGAGPGPGVAVGCGVRRSRAPQEVARYYDLVDVLAYPRHSMRLTELVTPLKPLEAMAQGKLFVASNVGGHRELIEHGNNWLAFSGRRCAGAYLSAAGAAGKSPVVAKTARARASFCGKRCATGATAWRPTGQSTNV